MLRKADYSQTTVIDKLNLYLKLKKRQLISSEGHCYGITLLWLQKMSEGTVNWFYETVDAIVECPTDKLLMIEVEIEKFLAMIEWAQNSAKHVTTVTQDDVDKLLEVPRPEMFIFKDKEEELTKWLRVRRNAVMYVVCSPDHAIGVIQVNGFYYVYDANYHHGRAKIFHSREKVVQEIKQCLFVVFHEAVPNPYRIELKMLRMPLLTTLKPHEQMIESEVTVVDRMELDEDSFTEEMQMENDVNPKAGTSSLCAIL